MELIVNQKDKKRKNTIKVPFDGKSTGILKFILRQLKKKKKRGYTCLKWLFRRTKYSIKFFSYLNQHRAFFIQNTKQITYYYSYENKDFGMSA